MNYKEYGKQNSNVIILLHGGGLSWWNYSKEAEMLQNDYHVIIPILDLSLIHIYRVHVAVLCDLNSFSSRSKERSLFRRDARGRLRHSRVERTFSACTGRLFRSLPLDCSPDSGTGRPFAALPQKLILRVELLAAFRLGIDAVGAEPPRLDPVSYTHLFQTRTYRSENPARSAAPRRPFRPQPQ